MGRNLLLMQDIQVIRAQEDHIDTGSGDLPDPWVRKIPWRKKWRPTPVSFPGTSMDRGAWQATAPRVTKTQTQLSTYEHLPTPKCHIVKFLLFVVFLNELLSLSKMHGMIVHVFYALKA